jgi:hypothetical protein
MVLTFAESKELETLKHQQKVEFEQIRYANQCQEDARKSERLKMIIRAAELGLKEVRFA